MGRAKKLGHGRLRPHAGVRLRKIFPFILNKLKNKGFQCKKCPSNESTKKSFCSINYVLKGKQRRHWYEAFTIWSRPGLQESIRYKLQQIYGTQAIFIHIRSKVEFFDNSYALLDLIIAIRSSEHTLFQKASRILLTWSVSLSFIAIFTIHLTFIPSPHPQLSLWWPAAVTTVS